MNIHARIARIVSKEPPLRTLEIHAVDEDDYCEKLLLSGLGPGPVHSTGTVSGPPIDRTAMLLSHEEYLELLD